jgi:phosphoribosylglycinamide formyltransferase-1
MNNIVILISGGGSNMAAIARTAVRERWAERLHARIAGVISNVPDAKGLALATELGLPTAVVDHKSHHSREAFDQSLMQVIDSLGQSHLQTPTQGGGSGGGAGQPAAVQPALVVLAGFMRILTPAFVSHYAGRMINIHPSLLPAFTGLHTYQRAIDAGCRFAGATVHQVTAELDHGPILAQAVVPVLPGDDATTLAARILTQEHRIYPQAIADLLQKMNHKSQIQ